MESEGTLSLDRGNISYRFGCGFWEGVLESLCLWLLMVAYFELVEKCERRKCPHVIVRN